MKKTSKLVEEFVESVNPDTEAGMLLRVPNIENGEGTFAVVCGQEEAVGAALATMIDDAFDDNVKDEREKEIGKIIVNAVETVIASGRKSGLYITKRIHDALSDSLRNKVSDILANHDNDDKDEDCSTCPINRVCNEENAIAYRKANHIRKPKGSKSNKNK